MPQPVLLNNVDHLTLKVDTRHLPEYGDNVLASRVYPLEFRHLQPFYPIFLQPNTEGEGFQPVALFGVEQQENVFLSEQGWQANYIPLLYSRGPFLIGQQQSSDLVIHVDMDDPRVNSDELSDDKPWLKSVFLPHGGHSPYIENIASVLQAIHQGEQQLPAFSAALTELDLVESFFLDLELPGEGTKRLSGFYTVSEDKLAALDGDALHRLHQAGWLQAIYMMLASHSQITTLIERRQFKQLNRD